MENTFVSHGETYYRQPARDYSTSNDERMGETNILSTGKGAGADSFYNIPVKDIPAALVYKREELAEFERLCKLHGVTV